MSLITLGVNHKTTPVDMRERLAFTPENLPEAVKSLTQLDGISEAVILSTCNRTELYCTINSSERQNTDRQLVEWFSQFHGFGLLGIFFFHHYFLLRFRVFLSNY